MNRECLGVTSDATDLDVDDLTASQFDRLPGARRRRDAFIQTNWRRKARLQLRMIDQVIMIERLFDHQQLKIVQPSQVFFVSQRVGRVGIDGKQDVWITLARFPDHLNIPARFNLEFNALITKRQISLDSIEKSCKSWLNPQAYSHGHRLARAANQLR